jgi:hypothetical protein
VNTPKIRWDLPPVRRGFGGFVDKAAGPGATNAEYLLQLLVPGAAALAAYFYAAAEFPSWSWWTVALYCVLAFDMVGGMITNSTSTAKRWFHREGQTWRNHLTFVAIHIVQISVVAIVFRDLDMVYGASLFAYLMSATVLILIVPRYLQRPIAVTLCALGMLLEMYAWGVSSVMPWFTPLLLLKLLISHLLYEEPYRPENEALQ